MRRFISRQRLLAYLGALGAGIVLASSGCTHVQLQRNTVRQARTVGDIHTQQVLNNLAMFVYDSNSMPSFSVPNQGGSNVTDTGNASVTPGFGRATTNFLFDALGLNFGAAREAQESFTMTPVNDPRKLELMRCAYQQAVANCGRGEVSEHCPDCQTIQNKFYTGDPDGDIPENAEGTVTSECLKPNCWFCVGCKKDVPKGCPCLYVGEYCGVYVWVPAGGRDELTKLTLAILDYALNDPPAMRTKLVTYYIDENGLPTTQKQSVGTVTATVNIDENNASLLNTSKPEEAKLEQILKGRLQVVNSQLTELESTEKLSQPAFRDERNRLLAERASLDNKLQYISEQFRKGVLKDRFYPPTRSMVPGSLLLPFNLQQQTLTAPPPGFFGQ